MGNIVTLNTEIIAEMRKFKVDINEGTLYLLGIYFDLNTDSISEATRKKVNAMNLVLREYRDNSSNPHRIKWKVPLFLEEKDDTFVWITDYMEAFGRINPTRKGTKDAVMSRMKKFFAEHPEVRVDDIKAAIHNYFKTVTDPQYLKSAHKFIYEGTGFARVSLLEQYVEQVRESKSSDGRTSKMK